MKKLAIVTLTRGARPEWFELCKASVAKALPKDAEHVVVQCPTYADVEVARWESLKLAEYIAFVDDDDLVINDSINKLLAAIEKTGCGVAFTDEQRIDANGKPFEENKPVRSRVTYMDIATGVLGCHHLAVIRTSAVPPEAWVEAQKVGAGIDWLINATAALTHGAVRVPIYGYQWRHHSSGFHMTTDWKNAFNNGMAGLRKFLRGYEPKTDEVPIFKE